VPFPEGSHNAVTRNCLKAFLQLLTYEPPTIA
jgi:hypothetical protein